MTPVEISFLAGAIAGITLSTVSILLVGWALVSKLEAAVFLREGEEKLPQPPRTEPCEHPESMVAPYDQPDGGLHSWCAECGSTRYDLPGRKGRWTKPYRTQLAEEGIVQ